MIISAISKVFGSDIKLTKFSRAFSTTFKRLEWPHMVRKDVEDDITALITKKQRFQSKTVNWLVGSRSSGKTWAVLHAVNSLRPGGAQDHKSPLVALILDGEALSSRDPRSFVLKLEKSLRTQLLKQAEESLSSEWILTGMLSHQTQHMPLSSGLMSVLSELRSDDDIPYSNTLKRRLFPLTAISGRNSMQNRAINSFLYEKVDKLKEMSIDDWKEFLALLPSKCINPEISPLEEPSKLSLLLYLVACAAERDSIKSTDADRSKQLEKRSTLYNTQEGYEAAAHCSQIVARLIRYWHSLLAFANNFPSSKLQICIIWENFEALYVHAPNSIVTEPRIPNLLSALYQAQIACPLPNLIVAEQRFFTALAWSNRSNSQVEKTPSFSLCALTEGLAEEGSAHTNIVQLPGCREDIARIVFIPAITNEGSIFKAIWEVFGGSYRHLKQCFKELSDLSLQFSLEHTASMLEKERTQLFDDGDEAPWSEDCSDAELLAYLWLGKQKIYIRNLLQSSSYFKEEVAHFEGKVQKFFTLALIQRHSSENFDSKDIFYELFHTVSALLGQKEVFLESLHDLEKIPVLQGLLEVGILQLCFHPIRLYIADTLTRHLLSSYLVNEYDSLSWSQKLRYKQSLLLGSKPFPREIP